MSTSKVTVNRRAKAIAKEWERRNKEGWPISGALNLPDGTKFTIAGVRLREDGTIQADCNPGEETILTAKNV